MKSVPLGAGAEDRGGRRSCHCSQAAATRQPTPVGGPSLKLQASPRPRASQLSCIFSMKTDFRSSQRRPAPHYSRSEQGEGLGDTASPWAAPLLRRWGTQSNSCRFGLRSVTERTAKPPTPVGSLRAQPRGKTSVGYNPQKHPPCCGGRSKARTCKMGCQWSHLVSLAGIPPAPKDSSRSRGRACLADGEQPPPCRCPVA